MIAITAPCWTLELLHNKLDVILAPTTAPTTAPTKLKLYLKFLSQNNRLENMRSNLSSPTIVIYHTDFNSKNLLNPDQRLGL